MNITLPTSFAITSRDSFVDMDVSKLRDDIITKLVLHGLTQKIGDSAASALADAGFGGQKFADLSEEDKSKVRAEAKASMQKVADALMNGEWGVERTGGKSVDPVVAEIRSILRQDYKKGWIAENSAEGWKALDEASILMGIDKLFADQDETTQGQIKAAATESLRLKAAAKSAVKGFKLAM